MWFIFNYSVPTSECNSCRLLLLLFHHHHFIIVISIVFVILVVLFWFLFFFLSSFLSFSKFLSLPRKSSSISIPFIYVKIVSGWIFGQNSEGGVILWSWSWNSKNYNQPKADKPANSRIQKQLSINATFWAAMGDDWGGAGDGVISTKHLQSRCMKRTLSLFCDL